MLQANIASSALVIAFFMNVVDVGRNAEKFDFALAYLKSLAFLAMQQCLVTGGFGIHVLGAELSVDAQGVISNFDCLPSRHRATLNFWIRTWDYLKEQGHLTKVWQDQVWSLLDVVIFATLFRQCRTQRGLRQQSENAEALLDSLKEELVKLFAHCLHEFVWRGYSIENNIFNQNVPSRSTRQSLNGQI